jgi:hypothetical protein
MVGYLKHKRLSDRDFSAGIVGLAVARHLKLIHADGIYRLVRQQDGRPVRSASLSPGRRCSWRSDRRRRLRLVALPELRAEDLRLALRCLGRIAGGVRLL